MDVALNDRQRLLRDSVRDYLRNEITFDRIRGFERDGGMDTALWDYLQSAGYLGLPFPEEMGGGGGELTDAAVVLEELTRRAVVIPFMETMACGIALQRFGRPEHTRSLVEGIAGGTLTLSPALLDAGHSVAGNRLDGKARFVDYGAEVSHHLVIAGDRRESGGLYVVDARGDGAGSASKRHIGRTPQAEVTYTNTPVEQLGGPDAAKFLFSLLRCLAAIQCVGNSQQALDMTTEYVSMRVQFGRPIGTFQAVQHHCANMATMTLSARFLAYEALWKLDRGLASDREIARAKVWASRTATEVPMLAHQLHGGIGYTEEYDLHFFSRRGKERALAWGSADECMAFLADTLPEEPAWQ
ncbi:MAG: acyl-CoA dehydrogenase family protein [Dehalococcoidia bacterium]